MLGLPDKLGAVDHQGFQVRIPLQDGNGFAALRSADVDDVLEPPPVEVERKAVAGQRFLENARRRQHPQQPVGGIGVSSDANGNFTRSELCVSQFGGNIEAGGDVKRP